MTSIEELEYEAKTINERNILLESLASILLATEYTNDEKVRAAEEILSISLDTVATMEVEQ